MLVLSGQKSSQGNFWIETDEAVSHTDDSARCLESIVGRGAVAVRGYRCVCVSVHLRNGDVHERHLVRSLNAVVRCIRISFVGPNK